MSIHARQSLTGWLDVSTILSSRLIWRRISQLTEIGEEETVARRKIIGLLRKADVGLPIKALCRNHGFSDAAYSLIALHVWCDDWIGCQATQSAGKQRYPTQEAPSRAGPSQPWMLRASDRLARSCGRPKRIRSDNGKAFCGKVLVAWAQVSGLK